MLIQFKTIYRLKNGDDNFLKGDKFLLADVNQDGYIKPSDYVLLKNAINNGTTDTLPDSTVVKKTTWKITNTLVLMEGKIDVKYIDKSTNTELSIVTKNGYVGDKITTESQEFPGYKLVGKPETEEYTFTKEPQTVKYYYLKIGSISINKVDKEQNPITSDVARFELEDEEGNKLYFKQKEEGLYTLSTQEDGTSIVETKEGKLKIEDVLVGKYKIIEIKSPNGFNLLKNKVDIELTNDNCEHFSINIVNNSLLKLPVAGGYGSIYFIAIGLLLISTSIAFYIKINKRHRKMKEKKNET